MPILTLYKIKILLFDLMVLSLHRSARKDTASLPATDVVALKVSFRVQLRVLTPHYHWRLFLFVRPLTVGSSPAPGASWFSPRPQPQKEVR